MIPIWRNKLFFTFLTQYQENGMKSMGEKRLTNEFSSSTVPYIGETIFLNLGEFFRNSFSFMTKHLFEMVVDKKLTCISVSVILHKWFLILILNIPKTLTNSYFNPLFQFNTNNTFLKGKLFYFLFTKKQPSRNSYHNKSESRLMTQNVVFA